MIKKRKQPVPTKNQLYILNRVTIDCNGCWNWDGALNREDGYGVAWNGKACRAHRFSYEAFVGPTGDNHVLHHCDNPKCCNPDHLYLGTHQDNADDKLSRERQARGERQGLSRLTEQDVAAIRDDKRSGTLIGAEYGVSRTTVNAIRRGDTWRHVT